MSRAALAAWVLWLLFVIGQDFFRRRAPNWLMLTGVAFALISIAFGEQPFDLTWKTALVGAIVAFCFLLVFYFLKLMGAGDVKFAGALGLWVGVTPLLPIWIGASALAGLHAGLWLLLRRWAIWPRLFAALSGMDERGDGGRRSRQIPYAAYLAISALVWYALDGRNGASN